MKEQLTGFKTTVKKTQVRPYDYDGRLTVSAHYRGYVSCYESGRKLWTKSTGINRVSRGGAIKDAQQLTHDLIMQNIPE